MGGDGAGNTVGSREAEGGLGEGGWGLRCFGRLTSYA